MNENYYFPKIPITWRPWIGALRLKSISASLSPPLCAVALVWLFNGAVDLLIVLTCVLSAYSIQMGTNLVNEAFDDAKGCDRNDRKGDIRIVQRGIVTRKQAHIAGVCFFIIAIILGLSLILKGGMPILSILFFSVLMGYIYTAGPFSLAYSGLSDIVLIVFFGILYTSSAFYLQTGYWSFDALLAGLQQGFLVTNILNTNNMRDCEGDARVNKRTLVVRFGKRFACAELAICSLLPFVIQLYWIWYSIATQLVWIAFPFALHNVIAAYEDTSPERCHELHKKSGMLQLLFSVLFAIGMRLSV